MASNRDDLLYLLLRLERRCRLMHLQRDQTLSVLQEVYTTYASSKHMSVGELGHILMMFTARTQISLF